MRTKDDVEKMAENDFNSVAESITPSHKPTISTPVQKSSMSMGEFQVELGADNFTAIDFTGTGVVEEKAPDNVKFIKGERYSLSSIACDGFEPSTKVYEFVTMHESYEDVPINGIIVKQVGGERGKVFTLSKGDCDRIGIEYESGLQLFPRDMNWKLVRDNVPFNPNDMSTTPTSLIDNAIRYALLRLDGFEDYHDGLIKTPTGRLMSEVEFTRTLTIKCDKPLLFDSHKGNEKHVFVIGENSPIKFTFVYPDGVRFNNGNFISSDGHIYVLLILIGGATNDWHGLKREFLEGFNPNERLTVSWSEIDSYDVAEYEEAKERQRKMDAENKRKEKERARSEAEKTRRQREALWSSVKGLHVKTVPIPRRLGEIRTNKFDIPSMNLTTDSISMYIDTTLRELNKSFDEMDRSIRTIYRNSSKTLREADQIIGMFSDLIDQ